MHLYIIRLRERYLIILFFSMWEIKMCYRLSGFIVINIESYMSIYVFDGSYRCLELYRRGVEHYRWMNLNGELHRDNDQPAVIVGDGTQIWYMNGKMHRDNDRPAAICDDGDFLWYQYGKEHRDYDNPNYVGSDNSWEWSKNGETHREGDRPAVIRANGSLEWYINDLCHRDNDNPAKIWIDGQQEWFYRGECHRDDDKPAMIFADGSIQWYQHGEPYRDHDNPTLISVDDGANIHLEWQQLVGFRYELHRNYHGSPSIIFNSSENLYRIETPPIIMDDEDI
jgi:hypothetical protein